MMPIFRKNSDMKLGSGVIRVATHYKCRNGVYPRTSDVHRFPVPDDKVSWDVPWVGYSPVPYTSKHIVNQSWADPDVANENFRPKWNSLDEGVDRRSHFCTYKTIGKAPINPIGRTGVTGRGCLGRWGPNHAADPIVTRWKRSETGEIERNPDTGKRILQFVAIERRDCHEWAIPGGMVDPGERVSATLKREFMEESLNSLSAENASEASAIEKMVEGFFDQGMEIYQGYVDDPRNTDNAWMETVAVNFHDEEGGSVGRFRLTAGDDAVGVKWMDVWSGLKLYASHYDFVKTVAEMRDSFW